VTNVVIVIQIVIALIILNVWLLRVGKATDYRGGDARNMKEEFAVYGLPSWAIYVVGTLKLLFAILLIVGIWVPEFTVPAAGGMGVLMLGAVVMHAKVRDSVKKTLPAFTMLVLCVLVVVL
jgi:hypothetical protein